MSASRAGRPSRWQKPALLPAGWERGRRPGHELGNGPGANRSQLDFASGGRMLAGGRQGGGCCGAQKSLPSPRSQREGRRAIGGIGGMAVGIYRTRRQCLFAYHAGPAGEGDGATTVPRARRRGAVRPNLRADQAELFSEGFNDGRVAPAPPPAGPIAPLHTPRAIHVNRRAVHYPECTRPRA
jgi:hypothetical protein